MAFKVASLAHLTYAKKKKKKKKKREHLSFSLCNENSEVTKQNERLWFIFYLFFFLSTVPGYYIH